MHIGDGKLVSPAKEWWKCVSGAYMRSACRGRDAGEKSASTGWYLLWKGLQLGLRRKRDEKQVMTSQHEADTLAGLTEGRSR